MAEKKLINNQARQSVEMRKDRVFMYNYSQLYIRYVSLLFHKNAAQSKYFETNQQPQVKEQKCRH